jgi:hypothetical protein
MALLALEPPHGDLGSTTPEVESAIAAAQKQVAAAPRVTLSIEASAIGSVSVDGRPGACTTPCAIDLPEGEHVVRIDADGMTPEVRSVRVAAPQSATRVELQSAPPEAAARQWTAKYGDRGDVDSEPSMRLLSTALRAPRLLLVQADTGRAGPRLRGTLAMDGAVAMRAERGDDAQALVRDMLHLITNEQPLYQRPVFWLAIAGAALAAGAGTFVLLNPTVKTSVRF